MATGKTWPSAGRQGDETAVPAPTGKRSAPSRWDGALRTPGAIGRGGAPSPPGFPGIGGGFVGADRCVGPWTGPVSPGGHIGPPLRGAESVPGPTEIGAKNDASPNGAGRSPPPTGGAEQSGLRRGAPRVWLPPAKFRNGIWGVSHGHPALRKQHWWCLAVGRCGHRPLRREGEVPATTQASGAQRSVCAAVARKWVGIAAEIIPKGTSNAGQSLSHGLRPCQLPLHKGALGTGDTDRRVGPLGLLAMTMVSCHSEASAHTGRGNPSFLTMDGGRGFGPPSRRPLRKTQSTTQASRRAAKRPRQRPRGMGGNRRKNHPQRGPPPRPPRQRLAKRKARKEQLVKFDFCPMTSECSTAQKVRKSDKGPARALVGAALTEQNSLEPRPAAREGAPRP